ncbi:MAG: hypothetical protein DRI57_18880 [Deltaproteobacteria bacterium]|nr:MAG: hypothetical protein DRI57_18880 [Deltaproteobacteria bacterium]
MPGFRLLIPFFLRRETDGSPKFPYHPFKRMPWSETRWCPGCQAISHSRTAAFRSLQTVGFPFRLPNKTATIPISGLQTPVAGFACGFGW